MAFWKDGAGAIWIDDYTGRFMFCLWDPEMPDEEYDTGLPIETKEVVEKFGPLRYIQPPEWQTEIDRTKDFRVD